MNALAQMPQTADEVTAAIMSSNAALVEQAFKAAITSPEELNAAVDIVSEIKRRVKNIEGQRTELVKPLNDHVKSINAKFKAVTEPLEEAERAIKPKIGAYQMKVEEENRRKAAEETKRTQEALREAAESEAKIGNAEGAVRLAQAAHQVQVKPEEAGRGMTGAKSALVSRWVFDLVDIKALAAARPECVQVNSVAINAAIKAGARDIPGLVIREEKTVSIRG